MWFFELLSDFIITFIISLIVTLLFYNGPIMIYRFAFKKSPIGKKKGITITIVYGIVMYLVMSIISYAIIQKVESVPAFVIWGCVNYFILTRELNKLPLIGKMFQNDKNEKSTQSRLNKNEVISTKNTPNNKRVQYCRKCGNKLVENSKFCNVCGLRIDWN